MITNQAAAPKRMSFYATPDDQAAIETIQTICPHYTFNFIVREGMRLLKQSLQTPGPLPRRKQQVEHTVGTPH